MLFFCKHSTSPSKFEIFRLSTGFSGGVFAKLRPDRKGFRLLDPQNSLRNTRLYLCVVGDAANPARLAASVPMLADMDGRNTGCTCNSRSYRRRAWCRAEIFACWARQGTSDMYYNTNEGLKPLVVSDEILAEALEV